MKQCAEALDRLRLAHQRLVSMGGSKVLPVVAPPWNRMRRELAAALPGIGIHGGSAATAKRSRFPACDRSTRTSTSSRGSDGKRFIGDEEAVRLAMTYVLNDQPLGWLTHHAVHDADGVALSRTSFCFARPALGARRQNSSRILGRRMADLLTVRDLKVSIAVDAGVIKAVDGVSFRIPEGGTVALVGESGSGKSVVAQSIMGILPRIARIDSGEIMFRDPRTPGTRARSSRASIRPARRCARIRGGRISIIFQEPMTALSPLHTIGNQIGEALALHRSDLGKDERRAAVIEMLRLVGFPIR